MFAERVKLGILRGQLLEALRPAVTRIRRRDEMGIRLTTCVSVRLHHHLLKGGIPT
jgi:hypothetical protein